jgi:NAD-dependent deacetylase
LQHLLIDAHTRVLAMTGAGVSAESGVPTFRDANGLWENHKVEEVATPGAFADDPELVWRFYSQRRAAAAAVEPNPGHLALADLERRLEDRFLLVTQNVDGLHWRAGSRRLVEFHGNLFRTKCSRCDLAPVEDRELYLDGELPQCPACDVRGDFALLRPDIVWFGEMLDPAHLARIHAFVRPADRGGDRLVFLAVGTSGLVYPAAGLVDVARAAGAETWLVNADPPANLEAFDHFVRGKSGEVLPRLLGVAS